MTHPYDRARFLTLENEAFEVDCGSFLNAMLISDQVNADASSNFMSQPGVLPWLD
jgi:hypothetical protein